MNDTEFKEMEGRLDNWRQVVTASGSVGHCGSVESLFRRDRDEGRRNARRVVDELDGWRVEQAWKAMSIPWVRALLKFHYIRRLEQRHCIRAVLRETGHAIKRWHYRAELVYSVGRLKQVLDNEVRARHHSYPQFEQNPSMSERCVAERLAVSRQEELKPATAR